MNMNMRDTEQGVKGKVLEGLLSPVPCVGECNEVRYKGLDAAARMRSGREHWVRHKRDATWTCWHLADTTPFNQWQHHALVPRWSRSSSLLCLKSQQVDTRHRSRHMGLVHDLTVWDQWLNPQPTWWDHIVQAFATSFVMWLLIIGQALSLEAFAVVSVDHYERNERARSGFVNIAPRIF